jgi:hypothetical protein
MSDAGHFRAVASIHAAASRPCKAPAADVALLWSTVLLQRFSLPFGRTTLPLVIIPATLILLREFASERLQIDYDRLSWFVILTLATTISLLVNFQATALTSFGLFVVLYSLLLFRRSSTADRFRGTLWTYQAISAFIAVVAIAQFGLQFVIDGRQLIRFYGIFPESLLPVEGWNTIIAVPLKPSLIKSNGLFLVEPSILSQTIALAIIIEVLEFRRLWYLLVFVPALLVAYSGTGMMLVLVFIPLAGLSRANALLATIGVVVLGAALVVSGVIDLSSFTSRLSEFDNPGSSGFARFVAPFWLTETNLAVSSVKELLLGHGPGTSTSFIGGLWYGGSAATVFKLWYEYGFFGTTVFACFFASCFRGSACPKMVVAAVLFTYLFLASNLIVPSDLTRMIVLCTLTQRERLVKG